MYIKEDTDIKVLNASEVVAVARGILDARPAEEKHKEYFYVIGLNAKNFIQIIDLITFGTVDSCHPSIREIARTLIIKNCSSAIVFHNHPSGDSTPSQPDRTYTSKLLLALEVLGVKLLDSIVIGNDFYSLADHGELK